jgi:hypothetical protein
MGGNRYRRRKPSERPQFGIPHNQHKGPTPPPEVLPWFWHPERDGAQPPPAAFDKRLKEIDKDLSVCFSPVHERWLVWARNPRIGRDSSKATSWLCPGWQLLYIWEHAITHEYLPLNELVFHNLMLIDAQKYGNAKQYYDKIEASIQRQREDRDKKYNSDRNAQQKDWYQSMQISTAGKGNKFSLNHDGSMIDSPSTAAWRKETAKFRLPSDAIKQTENEKEKAFYGS